MKTYKSDISYGPLYFIIAIYTAVFVTILWIERLSMTGFILSTSITIVSALPVIDIYLHTSYTIDGNRLKVRSGILFYATCPIDRIFSITPSHTKLSAPPLSTERLCLKTVAGSSLIISPCHRDQFINDLLTVNPAITINI